MSKTTRRAVMGAALATAAVGAIPADARSLHVLTTDELMEAIFDGLGDVYRVNGSDYVTYYNRDRNTVYLFNVRAIARDLLAKFEIRKRIAAE